MTPAAPSSPGTTRRPAPPAARRWLTMLVLVVAGEAAFALPFVLQRVFRPTLLDVFGITNLELGLAFSAYGLVAMVSYLPGGPLADRFGPRTLIAAALAATALGGAWYASVPGIVGLRWLYGFWGLSTILLFWSALIRATRMWGSAQTQGRAFGLLDAGRGLLAALLASATVVFFGLLLPDDAATASLAEKRAALIAAIWLFTALTAAAAALSWWVLPAAAAQPQQAEQRAIAPFRSDHVAQVLRNPAVWLQGLIVISAYVGFKGVDDYGLFARDVFGFDDVQAATVGTIAFWARPIAALAAGLLGDRFGGVRTIAACFVLMALSEGAVAIGLVGPTWPASLLAMVVATTAAVYGLRGLYFAIFADAGTPPHLTGTAAGLVSAVGYTPDIFIGPVQGWCTDTYPGAPGHQLFFGVLTAFALLGLLATALFAALRARRSPP